MTDALLELDFIARDYTATQSASTSAFRSLHSAVADISTRSRKIGEATRDHLRALRNVMSTEKELAAAIASYTIPEWLVRVGEACCRRPKGDVNCSTSELCKAMSRLVLSKAYLSEKPYNPVAESLGQTVDRYVKNIVAAAEDRVLLRFMNAIAMGSSANGIASPSSNGNNQEFPLLQQSLTLGGGGTTFEGRRARGHSRTFSATASGATANNGGKGGGHGRTLSTGSEIMGRSGSTAFNAIANSVSVLFGDSPPADMLEASELLSALFRNYCRIRAVLEVKSHVCDEIYRSLEHRISEYRRLRIERGDGLFASDSGKSGGGLSSFFSSGGGTANLTAPERLARALKELATNALADSGSRRNKRKRNNGRNSSSSFGNNNNNNNNDPSGLNPDGSSSSSSLVTLGITDFPECVFGVSKAARDLSLDVSSFLEKYVLSSIPPPPRRKTATEKLLEGDRSGLDNDDSPWRNGGSKPKATTSTSGENGVVVDKDEQSMLDSSMASGGGAGGAPLDPDAADQIDELRSTVRLVPSEIIEVTSTFALELLAKMVSDLSVKEIYSLDTSPIFLLEAVQEAWSWRHVAREICGETEDLLYSIDIKVDLILQKAFDSLANLRDEPSNLTSQSFLDLMLAPRNATFGSVSFGVLYITGVQALSDAQPLNRDKRKLMSWHVDEAFRRHCWHPERDLHFGFSPLLVDAIRRMVSVHEATLHVVFAGSVERVDGLIKKADKAIKTKQAALLRDAKHKNQRNFAKQADGSSATANNHFIDFSSLNLTTMMEAESAAKSVFEVVRSDIETFFTDTLTNHLNWMSSVASAAFLLAHGTFEHDEDSGDMSSYCSDAGEDGEDNLLWFGVPAGKLRFHPAIFRANTLQKIIRRLSAPGVFDVSSTSQLVWSNATMMNAHQLAPLSSTFGGGKSAGNRSSSAPPNLFPNTKKLDFSAFSPVTEQIPSAFAAFDLDAFSSTPKERPQQQGMKPSATASTSNNNNDDDDHAAAENRSNASDATNAAAAAESNKSWREKILDNLLSICHDKLQQQIDTAGARWATILPNITQNETLVEISESDEHTPLTHDQRAEVKNWYWKATNAIVDELELWETGVVVIDDAGLKTTLGEAAFDAASKVFEEMKDGVLKGREWSTRGGRWLKFPLENLERALRIFRAPLLQNEAE